MTPEKSLGHFVHKYADTEYLVTSALSNCLSCAKEAEMETFVVLLSLGTLATAFHFTEEWNDWKQEYEKQYPDNITELRRFAIWQANKNYIDHHNDYLANHLGFTLGLNEYSDLDSAEFVGQMTGAVFPPNPTPAPETFMATSADIPFSVDWRTEGYVTGVKNQRHHQCGSCWAFSATGALEGQHFKATGNLVSLSEQNLVDCSRLEGNQGCYGGWPTQAFQYVIDNHGIDTEASYPYVAREEVCQFSRANIGATASSYVRVQNSEVALTQAIAEVGPISVCIDAAHARFQHYKGGVYYEPSCSTSKLNHCVLAVGYGRKDGKDMYIVKNSHGKGWGVKGYIFMSRNRHNNCGIASYASYPNVTP